MKNLISTSLISLLLITGCGGPGSSDETEPTVAPVVVDSPAVTPTAVPTPKPTPVPVVVVPEEVVPVDTKPDKPQPTNPVAPLVGGTYIKGNDGSGGFVNNPFNSRNTLKVIFPSMYTDKIVEVVVWTFDGSFVE